MQSYLNIGFAREGLPDLTYDQIMTELSHVYAGHFIATTQKSDTEETAVVTCWGRPLSGIAATELSRALGQDCIAQ